MRGRAIVRSLVAASREWRTYHRHPSLLHAQRSINIFKTFDKEALAKEREKILDEMNRGYFDDLRDMNKNGGKVITASKELEAPATAIAFPKFTVYSIDQGASCLPLAKAEAPMASLICMSFRASSQEMVESWTIPLRKAFPNNGNLELYEVSWIESGFLALAPVRKLLLMSIRASKASIRSDRKIVYSFGDSYDVRKVLNITNRLAGYMYLVDEQGRVRWRSSGVATDEEVSCLISCTSILLEQEKLRREAHHFV